MIIVNKQWLTQSNEVFLYVYSIKFHDATKIVVDSYIFINTTSNMVLLGS